MIKFHWKRRVNLWRDRWYARDERESVDTRGENFCGGRGDLAAFNTLFTARANEQRVTAEAT